MTKFYGAIGFTGETRAGPFWWQILRGRKTQTIREPRKDERPHVIVGEFTKLYWKMRMPEKEKPIHLIAYAKVLAYEKVCLLDLWYDEENARDDGFENLEEFRLWFLPQWPEFDAIDQEAIRAAHNLEREIGEVVLTMGRRVGKSRLSEIIEALMEPMMRIVFEVVSAAKPTCPLCEKLNPGLDPVGQMTPTGFEYNGLAQCNHCSQVSEITAFRWSRPERPLLLKFLPGIRADFVEESF